MELLGLILGWFFCAALAGAVAFNKGRSFLVWAFLGLMFGCFAVVAVALMPSARHRE